MAAVPFLSPACAPQPSSSLTLDRAQFEALHAPSPGTAHVLSSAQLRELAAQWRVREVNGDHDRAERVATTLEWVADQRERQARRPMRRLAAWLQRLR